MFLHLSLNYHTKPNHRHRNSYSRKKTALASLHSEHPYLGIWKHLSLTRPLGEGRCVRSGSSYYDTTFTRKWQELLLSFWKTDKHKCWIPETRFVLICILKYTTSAISMLRAKVAAALGLASVTTFPRQDEMKDSNSVCVLPTSCEMGPPFHTTRPCYMLWTTFRQDIKVKV